MSVLFITPTYNEAENLPELAQAVLSQPVADLRLLVIDDNSPDGTGQVADRLKEETGGRVQVIHRSGKLGLGTAYIEGFRWGLQAGYDAIGQMDADFSHDPVKIPELVAALQETDLALGSRYVPGGSLDACWPAWRKFLSGFGNLYARTILSLPVRDVTGGFRLWRRETLLGLPLERVRSNGYVFQVEMTYLACRLGYRFQEIPIYFAERRCGQSKMSLKIQLEAALNTLALLGRYRDLPSASRRSASPR